MKDGVSSDQQNDMTSLIWLCLDFQKCEICSIISSCEELEECEILISVVVLL